MNPVQAILILIVRLYRWVLSPAKTAILGPAARCRYTPSCSAYALEAIQKHGALRGSLFAVRRLCRCHPWGDAGFDPVPERHSGSDSLRQGLHGERSCQQSITPGKESVRNVRTAV